jgi:UDP-glucose 4-epimerase
VRIAVDEAEPDIVFHLAAAGVTNPAVDPMLALMVNAGGTVNLLEALRGSDVQRVVLVGTSHEYGAQEAMEGLDPFSAYAASKIAAWAYGRMYWRAYDLPVITVRPFQVYGPGQPHEALIPATIRAALFDRDFPMTPGEQELDFVYAEDVVDGMTAAAEAPEIEGESLDLGTGAGYAIRSIVDQIWRLTGARGEVRVGALPYRSGGPMRLVADAERTAQLTGWRAATPLEEGLCATIRSLAEEE